MGLEMYILQSGSLWFSDAFSMKMIKFKEIPQWKVAHEHNG